MGAVARILVASAATIPLEQVLPVLFNALPLKEDQDEATPLFVCFTYLLTHAPAAVSLI